MNFILQNAIYYKLIKNETLGIGIGIGMQGYTGIDIGKINGIGTSLADTDTSLILTFLY